MKLYLPIDKVQWYLNQNSCGKILKYAMDYDKENYTKKVNRTLMSTIQHSYHVKMQTNTFPFQSKPEYEILRDGNFFMYDLVLQNKFGPGDRK